MSISSRGGRSVYASPVPCQLTWGAGTGCKAQAAVARVLRAQLRLSQGRGEEAEGDLSHRQLQARRSPFPRIATGRGLPRPCLASEGGGGGQPSAACGAHVVPARSRYAKAWDLPRRLISNSR